MNVLNASTQPAGTPIILAKIFAGVWCRAWVNHATDTWKIPMPDQPGFVYYDKDTAFSLAASIAAVDSTPGGWIWESDWLYVRPPVGESVYEHVIQAVVQVNVGNHLRVYDAKTFEPRIKSAPNVSERIEAQFGGVAQVGGGSLTLSNEDSYFDDKLDWQWDAREVQMWLGITVPGAVAADVDFQRVATWSVSEWSRTASGFVLQLREPKANNKVKLPLNTFERDTYPNIEDGIVGKAIPMAYGRIVGARGFLIDPAAKEFKVADHEIFSFDGVRVKKSIEQTYTEDLTSGWVGYSSDTFRIYKQGPLSPREVLNGATVLTTKSTAAQVDDEADSWAYQDGWLYVNPGGDPLDVSWDYSVSTTAYATSQFITTNLADATFTLGDDWVNGSDVSVDFTGKPAAGKPIETPPSIIQDIMEEAGATVDTASVNTANEEFTVGVTMTGALFCRRCLGIIFDKQQTAAEMVGAINGFSGTYTFTDGATGSVKVGAFWPKVTPSTADIQEHDILDAYSDNLTTDTIISRVDARYANRAQDGFSQLATSARPEAQFLRNQPDAVVEDRVIPVPTRKDAEHYAQRWSLMRSKPIRKFTITLFLKGWNYTLGSQLYVYAPRRGMVGKFEVIERNINLGDWKVRLVLGDMRGLGDSVGWWVSDAQALPTAFASLTGYGSGSVVWNSAWDDRIKAWARNNVGYWTDDNGFADPSDTESFIPSSWF